MAARVTEFFGFPPLDTAARSYVDNGTCPFIKENCIKPKHGACSIQQVRASEPVICCPNRMYANSYAILADVAETAFGQPCRLISPAEARDATDEGRKLETEVVVFGHNWGQELPLPRPPGAEGGEGKKYYVDWILTRIDSTGELLEFTAVEVQTIDTTGNYREQSEAFFRGKEFVDSKSRNPGFSNAGLNWENVNKRILPQIIYKGHVLRRERKCSKGLFFVCPEQVYDRIRDRLGGELHEYHPGDGTITFRSYKLGDELSGQHRPLDFSGQFTTTVDQVALAFTSPMNLPQMNVYENAIAGALGTS